MVTGEQFPNNWEGRRTMSSYFPVANLVALVNAMYLESRENYSSPQTSLIPGFVQDHTHVFECIGSV
jgi:hypothetical protein